MRTQLHSNPALQVQKMNLGFVWAKTISERTWSISKTRYDFNGKETDVESGYQDYGFRDYDVEICRFLQVDPLHGSYPELSTYQFASNTPICAIDLDGLEAVHKFTGQMFGKTPSLQLPSQWFIIDGVTEIQSFDRAARFNTDKLNIEAYKIIKDRCNYYQWADKELSGKSNWFGAAAIASSWNAIGTAENINLWFLNDDAEKFIRSGNKYLFCYNMSNFKNIKQGTLNFSFRDANGSKVSLKGLSGKQLDYALVQFEQTKVQEYITKYKQENLGANMSKIMESISYAMTSWAAQLVAPTEINQVMEEHFNIDKGQEAFDFGNYDHRVILGQRIVDKLYQKEEEQSKQEKKND